MGRYDFKMLEVADYFVYKGISYAVGTEIALVDEIYLQYRGLNPSNNYKVIFKKMYMESGRLLCLIEGFSCIFHFANM